MKRFTETYFIKRPNIKNLKRVNIIPHQCYLSWLKLFLVGKKKEFKKYLFFSLKSANMKNKRNPDY